MMSSKAVVAMPRNSTVTASAARQSRARIRIHGLPRYARKDGNDYARNDET